jgi:hypothetical protein
VVVKSNGARQLPQNPLMRPGRSAVERPTGRPHAVQKRSSSGLAPMTAAIFSSLISAESGSPTGVGATSINPAPSCARDTAVRREEVRRDVGPLPVVVAPLWPGETRWLGATGAPIVARAEARGAVGAATTAAYFAPHVSQ